MRRLFRVFRISRAFSFLFFAFFALAFAVALRASAQGPDSERRLPPGPSPAPGVSPGGPFGGAAAENYLVTSAANERGSFLWIVAPIQQVVILCEKPSAASDFSCSKKRLP